MKTTATGQLIEFIKTNAADAQQAQACTDLLARYGMLTHANLKVPRFPDTTESRARLSDLVSAATGRSVASLDILRLDQARQLDTESPGSLVCESLCADYWNQIRQLKRCRLEHLFRQVWHDLRPKLEQRQLPTNSLFHLYLYWLGTCIWPQRKDTHRVLSRLVHDHTDGVIAFGFRRRTNCLVASLVEPIC